MRQVQVTIQHFGGAREVGATSYMIAVPAWGVRVLIDVGGRPSVRRPGEAKYPDYRTLDRPDLVLLTHGHFDHIAALPLLIRQFPDVPVYSTPPTRDIVDVNLAGAVRVDEMLRDEGTLLGEAPYSAAEAAAAAAAILELPYFETHERIVGDVAVAVTSIPAGHTLGAASFQLRFTHRIEGEIRWLALGDYSGDVTVTVDPLDMGAHIRFRPHGLVSECTYGKEALGRIDTERELLRQALATVRRRGGTTIIPVFALGRAQEVAALCWEWFDQWERWCRAQGRDPGAELAPDDEETWAAVQRQPMLPHTPVVIDGLAKFITRIYERHPHALSQRLQERYQRTGEILTSRHYNILLNDGRTMLQMARAIQEGRRPTPSIILSPSGMLVGGRVIKWLQLLGDDPTNALLFSGYLDCESPGGKLLALAATDEPVPGRVIEVGKDTVPVALPVCRYRLRAHVDGPEIARVMALLQPRYVVLAHGDPGAAEGVASLIEQAVPSAHVVIPANLEVLQLEVTPDQADGERVSRIGRQDGRGVDRVMYGLAPAAVYLAMRAGADTTHDPRDLAHEMLGVSDTAAERGTSIRLVNEALETYENLLFRPRADDGSVRWTTVQASQMTGWLMHRDAAAEAEDLLWSSVTLDPPRPGLAVVRHLIHHPRLAVLGPRGDDGEHPAIVALGRQGSVHAREVMLSIEGVELGACEWPSSLAWARMMRRALTTLQLEAERLLGGEQAEKLLAQAGVTGAAAAAFRAAWDNRVGRRACQPLSSGARALLDRLREVVAATGERRVMTVSTRSLRSLLRQREGTARTSSPTAAINYPLLRELTSVVNEVRRVLGMPAVAEPSTVLLRYPFDISMLVAETMADVGPSAPIPGTVPLTAPERIAIALHYARLLCDPLTLGAAG